MIVERASSNRSTCSECKQKIPYCEKRVKYVTGAYRNTLHFSYYCKNCAILIFKKLSEELNNDRTL